MILVGVSSYLSRHRDAATSARWTRFWSGKELDVDTRASDYGLIAVVFIAGGIAILILRPFS